MVNKSTNVNKTNNYFLPQITEHKKSLRQISMEIQVLAWGRHNNVAGLNWIAGSLSSTSLAFNSNTDRYMLEPQYVYKHPTRVLRFSRDTLDI